MKYLYLLSCSLVVAAPAWAQGPKPMTSASGLLCDEDGNNCGNIDGARTLPDDEITVTATGQWQRRDKIGQSISVITADDLQAVQGPDLTRALERLPGVSLARSGGVGSQTSLFVRGANSEQLLVTIDGIRVEDIAAPSGGFDFGTVLSGGIGRVELLRGSNSLAWGSEAIGGVLALETDTRSGARASLEYGAHNTFDANAGLGLNGNPCTSP